MRRCNDCWKRDRCFKCMRTFKVQHKDSIAIDISLMLLNALGIIVIIVMTIK